MPGRAWSVLILCLAACEIIAADQRETYSPRDRRDVQTEVLQAVADLGVRETAALDRLAGLWTEPSEDRDPRALLELVVQSFAAVHPETSRFVESCRYDVEPFRVPQMPKPENAPECYTANVGLFYGRYLAQRRMYDEALHVLEPIPPEEVVDPASLLFFKAVCQHQLLRRDEGLRTLKQLLEQTVGVPASYRQVADLMQYELQNMKAKSLEELSHMMGDVERRLDLGRGGERVQKKEEEIIARLDEIIKKLEQQQGGGGSGAQGQGGEQNNPSDAAQDSSVKGATAEGKVDEKKLAGKGGWGMLDPKAETRARESIKRKFPPHYSEAIKRYNIKLAK